MARKYSYAYKVRIKEESLPAMQELSGGLGFNVDTPGRYLGDPSPAAMLDALAAAYRANPEVVADALRQVGVVNLLLNQS